MKTALPIPTHKVTKAEALAAGLKRYFVGAVCRSGHITWRRLRTSECLECRRLYTIRWRVPNRRAGIRAARRWQDNNPDRHAANQGRKDARRRAPGCLLEPFDFAATIPFYAEARRRSRETGIPYEVDHIVPLSGGGRHSADNLQVLTAEENLRKGGA